MDANAEPLAKILEDARARFRERHTHGLPAEQNAKVFADALAALAATAFEAAFAEIPAEERPAAIAVGAVGRDEAAPYSDLDLLIVSDKIEAAVEEAIKATVRGLWDAGLSVGQNVASPKQLLDQTKTDAALGASMLAMRRVAGSEATFEALRAGYQRQLEKGGARPLERAILAAVSEEVAKHGAVAELLEPNVKRSAGGLRHLHVLEWIGRLRCGTGEYADLEAAEFLAPGDAAVLADARRTLLRLRAELHLHAKRAEDVLTRTEQLRIAAAWGYDGAANAAQLPVENFMRDVLRRTTAVQDVVDGVFARPEAARSWRWWKLGLGSRSPDSPPTLGEALIAAADAANAGKSMPAEFVARLRRLGRTPATAEEVTPELAANFMRLLAKPGTIAEALRHLHRAGMLGRMLPEFEAVRCLIQFNAYHRYTVDEHTLVMLGEIERFADPACKEPPAEAYRAVQRKELLHLAVLLHDLGKGQTEDHSVVGARLAEEVGVRLGLSPTDRRIVALLVRHHLLLSRIAFHRDVRDRQSAAPLVRAVGREDVLQMLYALTAADVKAVGPEAYTPWKADLLAELYRRARGLFGGEHVGESDDAARRRRELWAARPTSDAEAKLALVPDEVVLGLALDDWAPMLDAWRQLADEPVAVLGRYIPERDAVRLTVLTRENVAEGVFHKICGALAAHRLEVQAAAIRTLADGCVLDGFDVRDVHHTGPTSPERLGRIAATVRRVLNGEIAVEDSLWSTRSSLFVARQRVIPADFVTVEIDNDSSPDCTVVDVFAPDRRGLLYTLASALFRAGLSVTYAKIATYSDEVMDVFYVRTAEGTKLSDLDKIDELRTTLIAAVQRLAEDPRSLGF